MLCVLTVVFGNASLMNIMKKKSLLQELFTFGFYVINFYRFTKLAKHGFKIILLYIMHML